MGRNNQARRQQKKRQKQKKQAQKQSGGRALKSSIPHDEFMALCDLATISLSNGEPPPPNILEDWSTGSVSAAARPLRSLLIGFIHFLFHHERAKGDLTQLIPHRQMMKQSHLAWLYSLLYAYCLISDQALVKGGADALSTIAAGKPVPCDIEYAGNTTEVLCAPLYLLLWVLGRPVGINTNGSQWLQIWLQDTPAMVLRPTLQKFLGLKHPKPEQKTVQALESALQNIDLHEQSEWLEGIAGLLSVFFKQRLTSSQRQSVNWQQQCPRLSRLGGLVDTPIAPAWSELTFSQASSTTLNRLNRLVDTTSMPYTERVSLEALKCRILSHYVHREGLGQETFERQLEQLIHLVSVEVPPGFEAFAEQCLGISCEWLAQEVGADRLPPPTRARMRPVVRLRPDDYRVALMNFMAAGGHKATANHARDSHFQHVHFPLFFQALNENVKQSRANKNALLKRFFWPLTGEAKKTLFLQCCQKIFVGMDGLDAEVFWKSWQQPLFDTSQEPFNSIINGQGCEAELLFYMTIAAVDTESGISWLKADQLALLVYSSEQLLGKHASDFNQQRIVTLLTSLISHQNATSLFQNWTSITNLLQHIKCLDELESFLHFAITTLNQQGSGEEDIKQSLVKFCWPFPALHPYFPDKLAPKIPSKKNKRRKKEKTSPNLDIFGDLL